MTTLKTAVQQTIRNLALFPSALQTSSATAPSTASFPVDISTIDVNCVV